MTQVMDQSQHTSADTGGEGAAYEFCQGLDSWEKQRELDRDGVCATEHSS